MARHAPVSPLTVLGAILLLALLLGAVLWLALPRERPADVVPTPTMPVIILPTSTRESTPTMITTPTPQPTEALPAATSTRVPTETPSATPTPAPPTATPDISKRVERG